MEKRNLMLALILTLAAFSKPVSAQEVDIGSSAELVQNDATTVVKMSVDDVANRENLYQNEEQLLGELLTSPAMNLCGLHVPLVCAKIEKAVDAIQENRRRAIEQQNKQLESVLAADPADGGLKASVQSILAADGLQVSLNLDASIRRLSKLKSLSGRTLNLSEKITVLIGAAHANAETEARTEDALRALIN